jgi:hypothetical protein
MASRMMTWALFGKPNQREWVPSAMQKDQFAANDGLYSSGYRLFQGHPADAMKALLDGAPKAAAISSSNETPANGGGRRGRGMRTASASNENLWKGWILPASDSDLWLTKGASEYHSFAADTVEERAKRLEYYRAQYREASLDGDQPLSKITQSLVSYKWHQQAQAKGVLLLDALRKSMGDEPFFALMKDFFSKNTTKAVNASAFIDAAGHKELFAKWLDTAGLPEGADGPLYSASDLRRKLSSAMIVYGTLMEAGTNRYAAEQLQKQFLDQFESAVMIRKDFEVTERELAEHDILFVGRPETNSVLAAWSKSLSLDYDGAVFRLNGKDHASENEAMVLAAANPKDNRHMVVIIAGNSPLSTVLLTRAAGFGDTQYQIFDGARANESGFLTK